MDGLTLSVLGILRAHSFHLVSTSCNAFQGGRFSYLFFTQLATVDKRYIDSDQEIQLVNELSKVIAQNEQGIEIAYNNEGPTK